jgi:uncharacterized protein (TIGR03085 family)
MANHTPARMERQRLAELLLVVGPQAPTLCGGWAAVELATHIVLRDRRPDIIPGLLTKYFRGHLNRVQREVAAQPWSELVAQVNAGPAAWVPASWAPVDALVNTLEFFVHHEDVLRANPEQGSRPVDSALADALWGAVHNLGRMRLRRVSVGVIARSPGREDRVLRRGSDSVYVSGEPGELALYFTGRREHAQVDVSGAPAAVARFQETSLTL